MINDVLMQALELLQSGSVVTDSAFNRLYPKNIRKLAYGHWTPVGLAARAAELLVTAPGTRVLDIGSGAGKFCFVGSALTEGIFTGIEQRERLVQCSSNLAAQLAWPRVTFVHGDAFELDWTQFDAFYLFNPFVDQMDSTWEAYDEAIRKTQIKLSPLRPGTRLVVLHGFGGALPLEWQCLLKEPHGNTTLELWIKTGALP